MHICKLHLYGQDAIEPVQQGWNLAVLYLNHYTGALNVFVIGSELLLRQYVAKPSSLLGFRHSSLLDLHMDDSIKQSQNPFVFSQLSFSFPECTVKSLTIVGQSIVLNFHRRVEVACTGICSY